jgi:hypothetical protein
MLHERHWTVEEANEARDFVAGRLRAMRAARRRLFGSDGHAEMAALAPVNGGAWPGRSHAAAAVELALGLEQLADLDIVVRDLDQGIVDFPALLEGDEVYLCWREGEPGVDHWHDPENDFTSRRPL